MTDEMIRRSRPGAASSRWDYLNSYISEPLRLAERPASRRSTRFAKDMAPRVPGAGERGQADDGDHRRGGALQPPLPVAQWQRIVDHIDHAVKIAGAPTMSGWGPTSMERRCRGMEDVTRLPKITEELLRRGYTEPQIKGILGENVLRLMERVETVAREIQNEAKPAR